MVATIRTVANTSRMVKPARRVRFPEACKTGFADSVRASGWILTGCQLSLLGATDFPPSFR
jgi:hypothetical protein